MSSKVRQSRVGDQVRVELADLLLNSMKDPRVGFATVTEVRMSSDLRHARVYVSVLGDDAAEAQTLAALGGMTGFLRHEIGRRIRLRHVPEIDFVADRTLRHSERIEQLLRDNPASAESAEPGDDDDDR